MATKVTFSQFGGAFVNTVVTERVLYNAIGPELQRMPVPPIDQQIGPVHVTGQARMNLAQLRVQRRDDASVADQTIAFDVFFGIHLTLYVNLVVGQENYEVDALVNLRLLAETWSNPLSLYFAIEPVPPAAIQVQSTGAGNWLNIVQRVGGLDDSVRSAIAERVNGALNAPGANASRTIDIQSMIAKGVPQDFHA